jgi:hypothetical protein
LSNQNLLLSMSQLLLQNQIHRTLKAMKMQMSEGYEESKLKILVSIYYGYDLITILIFV